MSRPVKVPPVRYPTAAELEAETAAVLAEYEADEVAERRRRAEEEARARLAFRLNADRELALATRAAVDQGYSFVADVWPDHPAAGFRPDGRRPCGVRLPFKLTKDGPLYLPADGVAYQISTPTFLVTRVGGPGHLHQVGILVGGEWVTAPLAGPESVERLVSYGLVLNPEACVWSRHGGGDSAPNRAAAWQLLWNYYQAHVNEVPWSR